MTRIIEGAVVDVRKFTAEEVRNRYSDIDDPIRCIDRKICEESLKFRHDGLPLQFVEYEISRLVSQADRERFYAELVAKCFNTCRGLSQDELRTMYGNPDVLMIEEEYLTRGFTVEYRPYYHVYKDELLCDLKIGW